MHYKTHIPSIKALCLVSIMKARIKERWQTNHKAFRTAPNSLYKTHWYLFGIVDSTSDNSIYNHNKFYKELDAKIAENNGAFDNIFTTDF